MLIGMRGEMWIDQQTYKWVKVTAEVIRPVSIEGFLAEVEPGTRFEIEKTPVAPGIWQIAHFTMQSRAKVLHFIDKNSAEEDWYWDFTPANGSKRPNRRYLKKQRLADEKFAMFGKTDGRLPAFTPNHFASVAPY